MLGFIFIIYIALGKTSIAIEAGTLSLYCEVDERK